MKWFQQVRKLSNVRRCGVMRTIINQNVAEHSYYAAILAMHMMESLEEDGLKFDKYLVVKKVLCHDVEESFTGDIPYPFKRMSRALSSLIDETVSPLVKEIFPPWMSTANKEAKEDQSGWIVKAVDYVELYAYCREETRMGNLEPYLKEIMMECRRIVTKLEHSIQPLESKIGEMAAGYIFQLSNAYPLEGYDDAQ